MLNNRGMLKINNRMLTPSDLMRKVKYRIMRNASEDKALQAYASLLLGYNVDLKNPKTFNEKLTWLKLNDRNPFYHKLVDKYEVKKIVAEKIGAEHVVPCYGVWDKFDDIDFDALPSQFVIKCTHYGAPIVVKDKSEFDIERAREIIEGQYRRNGYSTNFEWVYKDVTPRVLVDKFLDDHSDNNVLQDYKFWCFNGEPRMMYLTVKDTEIYENFYDMSFAPVDISHGFARRNPEFKKPSNFDEMASLAGTLSSGIPFVRIDFFSVNDVVYFGEYTFYDWAGTHPFASYEQDRLLGSMIDISRR